MFELLMLAFAAFAAAASRVAKIKERAEAARKGRAAPPLRYPPRTRPAIAPVKPAPAVGEEPSMPPVAQRLCGTLEVEREPAAPAAFWGEESMGSVSSEVAEGASTTHPKRDAQPPSQEPLPQQVSIPGLSLNIHAEALVQGVILSEILARKGRGVTR